MAIIAKFRQKIHLSPCSDSPGQLFGTAGASNTARNNLARFNADGSLDATFSTNPNLNNAVYAIGIDGNSKILVGGNFTTAGPSNASFSQLARFNADGTLDSAFSTDPNLNNIVRSIAIDGNGKIVVGGGFTTAGP